MCRRRFRMCGGGRVEVLVEAGSVRSTVTVRFWERARKGAGMFPLLLRLLFLASFPASFLSPSLRLLIAKLALLDVLQELLDGGGYGRRAFDGGSCALKYTTSYGACHNRRAGAARLFLHFFGDTPRYDEAYDLNSTGDFQATKAF